MSAATHDTLEKAAAWLVQQTDRAKQRLIQWPAAWADAMLEQRSKP